MLMLGLKSSTHAFTARAHTPVEASLQPLKSHFLGRMSVELRGKNGGTGTVLTLVAETTSCAGLKAQERLGAWQSQEMSPYLLGGFFN